MHLAVVKGLVEFSFRIIKARLVREWSLMDNRGPKRSSSSFCSSVDDMKMQLIVVGS